MIDYGRLRNAIIHHSREDMIIAEPHEDIVQKFEKIEELIKLLYFLSIYLQGQSKNNVPVPCIITS